MSSIIKVNNFTKKYGDFTAVKDVSFKVKKGSIFSFLGPNGAGKSTTINTLCTIFDKTNGELEINGFDVSKQKDEVRKSIGVVFQDPTLDGKMTIEENIYMHCMFYGVPKKEIEERIVFTLTLVDLLEYRKKVVNALSGGMKRRVEIARALSHNPEVLFLDEPTTGLDPQTRAVIWEYMLKLQKEKNITIFLTTHYMEEAEVSDQVAIMDHGQILAQGTPYELKKQYSKDIAYITIEQSVALETVLNEHHMHWILKRGYYRVEVQNINKFMQILFDFQSQITDLEIKKGTLNDVFLEITGRSIREELV